SGPLTLRNTIVARNSTSPPTTFGTPECSGSLTSLDHNLIEDPAACAIALAPHDRTGGAGLGIYTDDGTPGHGHWPLTRASQAIGAGDVATCAPTDLLARPRRGACDIGAVEFSPEPDPIAAFVVGFYPYALGREPVSAELTGWLGFLRPDPS